MESFESAKGLIVDSELGRALNMSTETTMLDAASMIVHVPVYDTDVTAVTNTGKYGVDTKYGAWMYIPKNAYYKVNHWLQIPWNTLSKFFGTASASNVLADKTFTSENGIKITGAMPSYTSGSAEAVNSSKTRGFDTTYGVWMYIPKAGYYGTNYWLQYPWNSIKGLLGNATAEYVLSGYTFTSSSGIKITGTHKYGVQILYLTATSSSTTYSFTIGDGSTRNEYWFYAPISVKNHVLCGAYYNKKGVTSGGHEYWIVNPMMIGSQVSGNCFYSLTNVQSDIKTSSNPWFPCGEASTEYTVTLYYVIQP
ncbi:MAG TPA: hypothetical protein DCW90_22180 [Lachnospiraceae bacterium]|nr:hypothetical protein [Lachnospiraceae bacterium]